MSDEIFQDQTVSQLCAAYQCSVPIYSSKRCLLFFAILGSNYLWWGLVASLMIFFGGFHKFHNFWKKKRKENALFCLAVEMTWLSSLWIFSALANNFFDNKQRWVKIIHFKTYF